MKQQRAEIRIIIRDGKQQGLYWQANVENEDFYYGPPHAPLGAILRGSYHKSGASHIHLPKRKKVGKIQLPPPASLTKSLRIIEQDVNLENIKWGYKMKANSEIRTNLLVDITNKNKNYLPSVEFWIIPSGQNQATKEIVSRRKGWGDILLGKVLVDTVSPWVFALVWLPSKKTRQVLDNYLKNHYRPPTETGRGNTRKNT